MKTTIAFQAACASIAVLLAGSAAAQESPRGFYLGGMVGATRASNFCANAALGGGVAGCDQRSNAWQGFAGYRLNNFVSAQVGYHDLGKASIPAGTEMKFNAWDFTGIAAFPVGNASLYGKAGYFRGEAEGGGPGLAGITENHGGLTLGAGVQWDFSRMFGLRAEWQRFPNMGGGRFGGDVDVNVVSVGALVRF
jgi:opacity protein-like surface antigen